MAKLTVEEFFEGHPASRRLFDVVVRAIAKFGHADVKVEKSQVCFRRKRTVAVVWMPGKYLKGTTAPLVLTLSFREHDESPRWKEITQVSANRFTHHLELHRIEDIDEQVEKWLGAAWEAAG